MTQTAALKALSSGAEAGGAAAGAGGGGADEGGADRHGVNRTLLNVRRRLHLSYNPQLDHVGYVHFSQGDARQRTLPKHRKRLLLDRDRRGPLDLRNSHVRRTPPRPGSLRLPSRSRPSRRGSSGSARLRTCVPEACARGCRWRTRCCLARLLPASVPRGPGGRFAECRRRTSTHGWRRPRYLATQMFPSGFTVHRYLGVYGIRDWLAKRTFAPLTSCVYVFRVFCGNAGSRKLPRESSPGPGAYFTMPLKLGW